jgi:hypothetical protein
MRLERRKWKEGAHGGTMGSPVTQQRALLVARDD